MDSATQNRPTPGRIADVAIPACVITGWWQCDLVTEELTWGDGVYDLFGFPRGSRVERGAVTARYSAQSRIALECLRVAAIRDKTGFTLDAEVTVDGASRWVRIVAQVECVDGKASRLVGTKSDVTHEKRAGLTARF